MLDRWIEADAAAGDAPERVAGDDAAALAVRLRAALDGGEDPELRPLRVAWLPPARDGERKVRIRDVLTFDDPRRPRSWRQQRIVDADPDRAQIVVGEPARLSRLVSRWRSARGDTGDGASGDGAAIDVGHLANFVRRQAALALERAETKLVGPAHKVPHLVREEVFEQARFQAGIRSQAERAGRPVDEVAAEASSYLDEMVTTFNRFAIDVTTEFARLYHRQGYRGRIHTDAAQLAELRRVSAKFPLVFLASHRSYMDPTVLGVVLRDNDLPPNHRLGGINMAFGPLGAIGRRAGVIYIRRSFRDNAVYKWVLREYIGYLAAKRFNLEWNIEGTRSRSGKLGPPKLGLLSYVVDAYLDGRCDDYLLIPVSILYDELIDVEEYSRYARGETKAAESVSWFLRYVARQRRHYGEGDIHVRFGTPLSLREMLGPPAGGSGEETDDPTLLPKVAFEVAVRINRATPITPTALAAMILLTVDRAIAMPTLRSALDYLLEDVHRRQLPVTGSELLTSDEGVEKALAPLLRQDALTRFEGGAEPVYVIKADQRVAASYYRNSLVHHFLTGAIAQVALVRATEPGLADPVGEVFDEALALRDLLKFEFFFADKAAFRDELAAALGLHAPDWQDRVAAGPDGARGLLREWRPLTAPVTLRSFLEAYLVVAIALDYKGGEEAGDEGALREEVQGLGRQLLLQGRIRAAEAVSAVLFAGAIKLAGNRKLLTGPPDDLRAGRQGLRADIERMLGAVDVVEEVGIEQFNTTEP